MLMAALSRRVACHCWRRIWMPEMCAFDRLPSSYLTMNGCARICAGVRRARMSTTSIFFTRSLASPDTSSQYGEGKLYRACKIALKSAGMGAPWSKGGSPHSRM